MTAHHHHVHTHDHSHDAGNVGSKAFAIGIAINLLFIVAEAYYGFISESLALLSDAGHNLSDVAGLILSWVGLLLASKMPKGRFTYGLQSASIVTAIVNSVLLLVGVGAILLEAFSRMNNPQVIDSNIVMAVAAIGIFVNGITAFIFFKSGSNELNIRAAFWHMAGDALVSLGVVISALVIKYTGWNILDGITSIIIAIVILFASWGLLKDSLMLSLHAAPSDVKIEEVKDFLLKQNGVNEVLDLHVWAISTTETALSTHLLMPGGVNDEFLIELELALEREFHIGHSTIQVHQNDFIKKHF